MHRDDLSDLAAFLAVAEARSFTRAAGQLGTSQSALSQTVRRLETTLGLKLLTRNTRRVVPTEAGEHLMATLRPALDEIDASVEALAALRDTPSGTIRLTTSRHAAETILWPRISQLMTQYPDIRIELSVDNQLTDIVSKRFDGGIRLGEQIEKDMIAIPVSPDMRMAVVASPGYLRKQGQPATPQELPHHNCINLRMSTHGELYAWEFSRDGRDFNVRVQGSLTLNDSYMIIQAAKAGHGLACLLEDHVQSAIEQGELVRLLEDWCPPFPGYHLYYPDRRQSSRAFKLLVEALRYPPAES